MPRLCKFRLERKISSDKLRKHVATTKQKASLQFHKLFLNNDLGLPTKLQQFLSDGIKMSDNEKTNSNKVRVVLKINECRDTPSCLTVNKSQNCVGVIDPTPSRRNQNSNTNVNHFPFDSILTDTDSPEFLFTDALVDPMMEFFKGRDSCIFSFGHSALGKTKSMVGRDQSISNIGIIPCALVWTFKLIDYLKRNNHHIRYLVRISAIEVSNKNSVSDLLADSNALSRNCGDSKTQGTYDQDKSNAILINQRELPASNLLEAAYILDTALATRSIDNESLSHMQLIIHLYQCRVDAAAERNFESNINNVKGEKSRLILLDLGSGRHGNEDQTNLSLQGISKVILALYTSQRHVPYKENVLTQLLKDTLNPNIATTMLLHISSKEQNYSETLQVVQLAYKLYRMRLKKYRSVGFSAFDETSSCSSSSSGLQSRRLRPHMGIGAARRSSGNSSASSEFDLTSASELSCCETVIFKGDSSHNLSDKSPDRLSGKKKLKSVSSDSDNGFSDKDTSKSLVYLSGSSLSPNVLRRRRTSPRTNARAWPSTEETANSIIECSPELWVDGPNAVYKVEHSGNQYLDDRIHLNKTVEGESNLVSENLNKPLMISKETQCDDVWDSASSITDGSSHSNTSDRKDHRPLSDISECTEETESNLAIESDFMKMNMIDQTESTNVLDDLLESTFGLSPNHQGSQYKPLEQSYLDSQGLSEAQLHLIEKMTKSNDITQIETSQTVTNAMENHSLVESAIDKDKPICRNSRISRKHHSTSSSSKRSSKSENKDKRSKSKCKKCSKKSENNCSKSVTSSSSTNFSRVTSWIEDVQNVTRSSLFNKPVVINNQYNFNGYNNHNMHHHSQPDISYARDLFDANRTYLSPVQYQHQFPHNIPWINSDSHQAQYSLYDGYNMTLTNSSSIPTSSLSRTNASYLPVPPATIAQMSSLHPIVTQQDSFNTGQTINSPNSRRAYTHLSNISLPVNGVSVTQLPLPPLPQPTVYVDTHVPIIENLNTSCSYSTPSSTSLLPIRNPPNPKCKTLPRDIYSDSATTLKRNQSDLHSSNVAESRFSTSDSKIKDKSKKESKNIIAKIFAPLLSFRKKVNKSKIPPEAVLPVSESVNNNIFYNNLRVDENVQLNPWPNIPDKIQSNLVLSSPYHLVTQPKTGILPTESSGNGSDSSSFHNRELFKSKSNEASRQHKSRSGSMTFRSKNLPRKRPTSSGYGSINIKGDSEVSSHNDSSSEYSVTGLTNIKNTGVHTRMKHSISLSNYRSINDGNLNNLSKNGSTEISNPSCSVARDINFDENTKMAEVLLVNERLKMTLNEERKIVIQLIEVNRLRGVSVEPSTMNLMCFRCLDVNTPIERDRCQKLIEELNEEIEQLKKALLHAQSHLCLITTFDCHQ